jgi:hypothetical protein
MNAGTRKKGLALGGPIEGVDPVTGKPVTPSAEPLNQGPVYTPQNPATTAAMNEQHAIHNLTLAQRFKNSLKGVNQNVVGGDEMLIDGQPTIRNTSANQYVNVDPRAIQKADSVIQAGRPILMKKKGLAEGGPLPPFKDVPGYEQPLFNYQQPWLPPSEFKQDGMNWQYQPQQQASIPFKESSPLATGVDTSPLKPEMKTTGYIPKMLPSTPMQDAPSTGNKVNWGKIGNTAATFGSNIVNQILIGKMKGPASPQLERQVRLGRVSAAPQLAEASSAFRDAQNSLSRGAAQTSTLLSGTGNLMAKRLSATNQIHGDVNRQNTDIGNQEAMMNVGVNARNNANKNQFSQSKVDFENMKKRMTSQNVANVSEKVQMINRENNQKEKDVLEYSILSDAYKDSGVMTRTTESNKLLEEYKKKYNLFQKRKKKN